MATVQTPNDDLVTHPEFAPAYMDKVAFQKDVVVSVLMPVFNFTNQLAEDVKDTIIWGGGEAMTGALLYYGLVKEAASKSVATSKPIQEYLS